MLECGIERLNAKIAKVRPIVYSSRRRTRYFVVVCASLRQTFETASSCQGYRARLYSSNLACLAREGEIARLDGSATAIAAARRLPREKRCRDRTFNATLARARQLTPPLFFRHRIRAVSPCFDRARARVATSRRPVPKIATDSTVASRFGDKFDNDVFTNNACI